MEGVCRVAYGEADSLMNTTKVINMNMNIVLCCVVGLCCTVLYYHALYCIAVRCVAFDRCVAVLCYVASDLVGYPLP